MSVQCSCGSAAEWCCHLVALCLHRIHLADTVKLRAPVSESLTRLQRDDLQKFAQVFKLTLYVKKVIFLHDIKNTLTSITAIHIKQHCVESWTRV